MFLPDKVKLLIIEDEEAVLRGLATYFSDSGYQVETAADGAAGLEAFRRECPDIIFTDLRMPVLSGHEVIREVKQHCPDTPVVVISGTGVVKDAVEALRLGAWDYVEKPVHDLEALEHIVKKALEHSMLRNQVAGLKQKLLSGSVRRPEVFASIVTRSSVLGGIFQYIEVIAPTPQPVLICGETGTGKELFARAVHDASGRKGRFVALNVAGLDDQMLSDTLFGHARGAFTGADKQRDGVIAQAAGGTLFLDEIGDLNEASQIKLLRLLQEGEYFPLGADHPKKSDARMVLATHRNLLERVGQGSFRQDLYYRLFAHQVCIPPLRERPDDIPLLLEHFLAEAAAMLGKNKPTPPRELCSYLAAYAFPGNVRELKAVVYEAVTRHTQGVLSMACFLKAMGSAPAPAPAASAQAGTEVVLREGQLERMPTLDEAEDVLIEQAMRRAGNNQGIAAGYLGINRSALNKKLIKRRERSV
ncbi:sigma-54-dependent transcriptional regulator [Geomonas agri]|uniref:sigma-54-dependent transcriptional regulator n=1 Tax=Geomonas agri TaxID=2873702 RepID=UPI001CD7C5BE|nr:sigma-54 dependent transcriptional regulator [Geomonas agri]